MQCRPSWETVVSATGFALTWVFVLFRVSAETVLQGNKWFDASLKTFTPVTFWKICSVILSLRCHCTVAAYPIVVPPCPIRGIFRPSSCIACFHTFLVSTAPARGSPAFPFSFAMPREPQLYLCDDWIQPMATMRKPRELTAREKMKANVAKNCLIVTLMSLELGYGSILERYQQEGESIAQRYEQPRPESKPTLGSVRLTDEEFLTRRDDHLESDVPSQAAVAAMPPPTRLSLLNHELAVHSVGSQRMKEAVKNANLKMYHVMTVKQTLREDLAEHAYQFSCRAADWSRSDFSSVHMRFEPLELHVVDALGQQEVPDYFQQPAKAITEDVSVMKGPDSLEWIQAVLDEIESFKRLGVYEEVPKGKATSTPLPARLILVTKPNVQGGPARKKARIVICGNFQEVLPDEFTASKTPSYPSLRMALSVASHMGWPIECWDVSTAFLYARLFGDRDTDLGGNEIFMRPPKILVETKVVEEGVVWKIKRALYGLRTSPIAWETERDNTLKSLSWSHEEVEYKLLPCTGSPCLWTVIPLRASSIVLVTCVMALACILRQSKQFLSQVKAKRQMDSQKCQILVWHLSLDDV